MNPANKKTPLQGDAVGCLTGCANYCEKQLASIVFLFIPSRVTLRVMLSLARLLLLFYKPVTSS